MNEDVQGTWEATWRQHGAPDQFLLKAQDSMAGYLIRVRISQDDAENV
jgi:hypothetical protein